MPQLLTSSFQQPYKAGNITEGETEAESSGGICLRLQSLEREILDPNPCGLDLWGAFWERALGIISKVMNVG
jgi:hypothetical protein